MIDFNIICEIFKNCFYPEQQDYYSISLARIFIGLVCFYKIFLIHKDKKYYSADGYFPTDHRLSLNYPKTWVDSLGVNATAFIGLISSASLCLGFLTQISGFLTLFVLTTLCSRNPYTFHSGSSLLRLILFLLIFSKCNQELSVDKYLGVEKLLPTFYFFEVLIKIQVAIMYIKTAWYKLMNLSWRDGASIHYATRNYLYCKPKIIEAFKIFFNNKAFLKLSSWLVLIMEFSIGFSAFFSDFWYIAFFVGLFLHISFIIFLYIKEFPYICIAILFIFIPSNVIENCFNILLK
jgi:hypothetical protein